MDEPITRRGVYKDLSLSPYEYVTPYGDIFKFPSQKKLDIYTREAPKEIDRMSSLIDRHDMDIFLPPEILALLYRTTYKSLYNKIVR